MSGQVFKAFLLFLVQLGLMVPGVARAGFDADLIKVTTIGGKTVGEMFQLKVYVSARFSPRVNVPLTCTPSATW